MSSDAATPAGARYRHAIEVRFGDTDALGHVNNAVYLSYFEAARAGYYQAVTGATFGLGLLGGAGGLAAAHAATPEGEGTRTFIIARAEIDYRAPAYFGDPLVVACAASWIGRSSFGLDYRIVVDATADAAERLVATGSTVQVTFDFVRGRVTRVPRDLVEMLEAFEGQPLPPRPG